MLVTQRLVLARRQQLRRLDDVLDLPPVQLNARQRIQMLVREPLLC